MFPKPLRREIVALICIKAALLFVLYQMFFSHGLQPDGLAVQAHIFAGLPR